ncbi:hypothetical protein ACUNV4_28950, partial [Granulosicoccus sp. 3-233]|uniref:hypothetical protein n=1 Tax=Granulosicoccus sp. 3-233 TaxID=3417969 RepID=UPI003D3480B6
NLHRFRSFSYFSVDFLSTDPHYCGTRNYVDKHRSRPGHSVTYRSATGPRQVVGFGYAGGGGGTGSVFGEILMLADSGLVAALSSSCLPVTIARGTGK